MCKLVANFFHESQRQGAMSDPSIKKRNKKRRKKGKGAAGEPGAADSQPNGQEKVPKVSNKGRERYNLTRWSWNIIKQS